MVWVPEHWKAPKLWVIQLSGSKVVGLGVVKGTETVGKGIVK